MSKKRDRIGLFNPQSIPSIFMDDSIATALKIKQKELANLDERVNGERSRLEHELATLDERAKQQRATLEEEVAILSKAANITAAIVNTSQSHTRRANRKHEREELFAHRSELMRRFLQRANGKEVHVRELARELKRPISTVKDYFNDQPNVRPTECFWTNGIDNSHFRWKDSPAPVITSDTPTAAVAAQPLQQDYATR